MKSNLLKLICAACLIWTSSNVHSQMNESNFGVDTLTFAERIAVRTNAVDWAFQTPNLGLEFDLRNKNWNRWSLGVNLRYNWQTNHTFRPGIVYNVMGGKVEVRNYWRTRQVLHWLKDETNKDNFSSARPDMEHTNLVDKLFSMRRGKVKHPATIYYRGFYVGADKFSVKLGNEGKEGTAFGAGFTYGIIRPLYVYQTGNSLDLEFGLSGGLVYTKYDTYTHNRSSDCYQKTGVEDWHIVPYPVLTEVKVGLVYRFGKYSTSKRYRWRYDVDENYQNKIDTTYTAILRKRIDKNSIKNAKIEAAAARRDSIAKAKVQKKYDKIRQDSIDEVEKVQKKIQKLHEKTLKSREEKKADKRKEKKKKETAYFLRKENGVIMTDERRTYNG